MARIEKTVFISYRRTNFPWALSIYQDLTFHGYDVFFDYQSIDSGNFEKVIIENIKARAHFIIILTPSALENCKKTGDWLRREIETAIDEKRNIVPIMLEGFDFGSPAVKEALIGKLACLSSYNGLPVPEAYALEAMDRLRERYLKIALSDVALPELQAKVQEITNIQKEAANEAAPVREEQLTAQTWFERGYVFQNDKNFTEAFRCYSEAINLDPNLNAAYNNLGVLLFGQERFAEAEEVFRQAIAKDPNYAAYYYNLGNLLSDKKLERFAEAEEAYRQAIAKDPDDAAAYSNLGILLKKLERYEAAEAAYRQAIAKDPDYAAAYNNLALLLRQVGRDAEAIPFYEKVIVLAPSDFNPYLGIASIQKHLGKLCSEEYLAHACKLIAPNDWYNLACLESICENTDLALKHLSKAVQKDSFDREWAWKDPDFEWIRSDLRFAEIVGPRPK